MEPVTGRSREKGRIVIFRLGQEQYGVEILRVKEVIHSQEVRAFPDGPDFIQGTVRSRNRRIPVLDLKRRLGVGGGTEGKQVIMIFDTEIPFGVAVDEISQILNLDLRGCEFLPREIMGEDREESCVGRVAKTENELILIITPEQILTRAEKEILKNLEKTIERG
ncbi:MAG: chemotaxis protein CheW [bacterium]|nr:chemotaxis protein CheW [bacterium]